MSLVDLEQTAALRTLAHLRRKGKCTRTQLIEAVDASTTTLYSALNKLRKLKLIQETKEKTFPFTVEITLTPKGQRIASHLATIEQILKTGKE